MILQNKASSASDSHAGEPRGACQFPISPGLLVREHEGKSEKWPKRLLDLGDNGRARLYSSRHERKWSQCMMLCLLIVIPQSVRGSPLWQWKTAHEGILVSVGLRLSVNFDGVCWRPARVRACFVRLRQG